MMRVASPGQLGGSTAEAPVLEGFKPSKMERYKERAVSQVPMFAWPSSPSEAVSARRAARPSSPLLGPPLAAQGSPCRSRSFKRSTSGGWPRQTAGVSVTCAARFGLGRRGGGRRPSRERGAGRPSPELLAPRLPLPLLASPAAPPAASARGSSEMAAGGAPRFSWRGRPAGLGEGRPR